MSKGGNLAGGWCRAVKGTNEEGEAKDEGVGCRV